MHIRLLAAKFISLSGDCDFWFISASHLCLFLVQKSGKMPQGFDKCKERSAHIDEILNGLNRYNPETTTIFQEYVTQQCEEKFFDTYACLALLKL